jgi:TP901 family phage tail tape measure protein
MNRTIEAILKLSAVDRTGNVLGRVAGKLEAVDRKARAVNRSQGMMAVGARAAGRAIVTGLAGYATIAAGKELVTNFASVERRLNRIAINAGESKDSVGDMMDVINRTSREYAMSQDDVTSGFETLIAAGQDYRNAMSFLPSITLAAQASGASVEDVANSALAVSRNFKMAAPEMQRAFDIINTSGKDGAVEVRDMAQYLPSLAPAMAALGYKGAPGLKKLVSLLQTVRLQTSDASSAATNLQNVLQKMETQQTANAFEKMGVDLRKAMADARRDGRDLLDVFVQLTMKATKGDLSKLPRLFQDAQVQQGMRAIIQGQENLAKFFHDLDDDKIKGSVLRDFNQVASDSQAAIDRLDSSWEKLKRSFGEGIVNTGVTGWLDTLSDKIDYNSAVNTGLERSGVHGFAARSWWGVTHNAADKAAMARSAGYVAPGDEALAKAAPNAYRILGRRPQRPHSTVTSDTLATPYDAGPSLPDFSHGGFLGQTERRLGIAGSDAGDNIAKAGQAVEDGGKKAGDAITSAADAIRQAGRDAGQEISRAIRSAKSNYYDQDEAFRMEHGLPSRVRVNADVGMAWKP